MTNDLKSAGETVVTPQVHAELQRYWLGAIDAKLAEGCEMHIVIGTMLEIGIAGLLAEHGPRHTAERLEAAAKRTREMAEGHRSPSAPSCH